VDTDTAGSQVGEQQQLREGTFNDLRSLLEAARGGDQQAASQLGQFIDREGRTLDDKLGEGATEELRKIWREIMGGEPPI
jgi:hypothetical protein